MSEQNMHTAVLILEAFGRRDADAVVEHFADDVVDDYVALQPFIGKEAAKAIIVEIFEAFPDFELHIDRIIAEGEYVSAQWTVTGTFTGKPFQGVVATGRPVEVRGCDFMEFRNGKLQHNTVYYDNATYARQIGALPPTGSHLEEIVTVAINAGTWIRNIPSLVSR